MRARAEGDRLPVTREEVLLSHLVETTIAGRRRRSRDARVTVETSASEELVLIDPVRVRQALENLLDNALRYSPADSRVRIVGRGLGAGLRTLGPGSGLRTVHPNPARRGRCRPGPGDRGGRRRLARWDGDGPK